MSGNAVFIVVAAVLKMSASCKLVVMFSPLCVFTTVNCQIRVIMIHINVLSLL
jgi:hypothetical protein